jgi:hypothetical protein
LGYVAARGFLGLCSPLTVFGLFAIVSRRFCWHCGGRESGDFSLLLFRMLKRIFPSLMFVAAVGVVVFGAARLGAEEVGVGGSFAGASGLYEENAVGSFADAAGSYGKNTTGSLAVAAGWYEGGPVGVYAGVPGRYEGAQVGSFAGASGLYGGAGEAVPASVQVPVAAVVDEPNASFLNVDVSAGREKAAGFEELPGAADEETLTDLEELAARAREEEGLVYLGDGPPPAYSFGYNRVKSALTWLPGHNDDFGWFSYESFGGAQMNNWPSLVSGFGVHFLDGPVRTDMPPRLFDFSLGLKDRRLIRPHIGYDIEFRVGVFSDFEGSAKEGVRYPGHAVTFFRFNRRLELVLGVDYLDRDDISLLPVAGVIWTPQDWLRVEAVFPRPRLAARIMNTSQWLFIGGELGGGTWAVERNFIGDAPNYGTFRIDDNATYRDLRLVFGWESVDEDSLSSSLEIGYVFDRRLSYRNDFGFVIPKGDYDPGDGWMMRMTARY